MTFPIQRSNERHFEEDWAGEVFVCDIDRTYLATRFSTLQGLARIPFEFAVDKRDIEGMVALLKEVRRGPGVPSRQSPLYFISASPAQLRAVIQRKMLLDGLEFDGTTFKDWVKVVGTLRLRRLRDQLGFKLTALLVGRRELPPGAQEVLIGDDLESDALAFTLYADLLSGRISPPLLTRILQRQGVAEDDGRAISDLARQVSRPRGEGVKRAYIRLERSRSPEVLLEFSPHVLACQGALQMAFGLFDQGSISLEGVLRVAEDLAFDGEALAGRLEDACRRAILGREHAVALQERMSSDGPPGLTLSDAIPRWAASRNGPWTPHRFLAD